MAERKKYKLTKIITQLPCGAILHRIRALRDIREGVKKGDLGGWVQTERNLSQRNTCWIYGEAKCYHYGKLMERSILYDHADIHDNGIIREDAKVGGTTIIRGVTEIGEDTWLYGSHDYNCKPLVHPNTHDQDLDQRQRGYDEFHIDLPERLCRWSYLR